MNKIVFVVEWMKAIIHNSDINATGKESPVRRQGTYNLHCYYLG